MKTNNNQSIKSKKEFMESVEIALNELAKRADEEKKAPKKVFVSAEMAKLLDSGEIRIVASFGSLIIVEEI